MKRQAILILALLFGFNTIANTARNYIFPTYVSLDLEQIELENKLFNTSDENLYDDRGVIKIESIEVVELEEESDIDFDTAKYIPEGFNALDGKNDINWDAIELVEEDEEVELGFDPKNHLPDGFDPYKGMRCTYTVAYVH